MAIHPERLIDLIATAGRLVGLKELARAGGFHPGEQTELKRLLRDLVRDGQVIREGKRFGIAGQKVTQKSGPAWQQKQNRAPGGARSAQQQQRPRGDERHAARALNPDRSRAEPSRTDSRRGANTRRHEGVDERRDRRDSRSGAKPAHGGPSKRSAAPPNARNLVEGIIHHHRDGFGFVKLMAGKSDDVFVPPAEARKALDGDRVRLEILRGRDGRSEGRIVDVVGRTREQVIGVYQELKNEAWVEPREAQLGRIWVPKTQLARPGDNVKVRLGIGEGVIGKHDELFGEVSGSLGSAADHSIEVLSVAYGKGFSDEFPDAVMAEADAITLQVSPEEAREAGRRDLRQMQLVTIDGEDARDFDDAIFVEATPSGWRLVVAIADVSHYVREGTALDDEALKRATSVYMPGRVLPMLPERLSNGICSLKPDEDRLCMVADMVISRTGETTGAQVYPAVMRSAARCTYTEVHQVLNGENVPHRNAFKPLFERANALALCLRAMRIDRGAIDFDLPETRVELGPDGLPVRMVRRDRWESHRLVEECMLAANEAVARFCRDNELPTVNRHHGEPDEEKLAIFVQLLRAYGIEVPSEQLSSSQLNQVLKQLEGHPEQRALNQLALRSMMQAVYSSSDSGHYGLGATDYLHFTSPIRRYPDLLVHRLLKAFWARKGSKKGFNAEAETERLEAMAAQSSERERAAMQVEREVSSLYSCLLIKEHVGEEFAATITGLSEHGFYCELDELLVDGFVKGESVSPDFELNQATYRLVFGGGFEVKVGQKLTVKVLSVNLSRKQIDYGVVAWADGAVLKASPGRSRFESHSKPPAGARQASRYQQRQKRDERPSQTRHQSGKGAPGKRDERPWARTERPANSGQPRREGPPMPAVTRPEPFRQPAEVRQAAPAPRPSGGFDARATLDRLWKERVGQQPSASQKRADDRRSYRDNDQYARRDRQGPSGKKRR